MSEKTRQNWKILEEGGQLISTIFLLVTVLTRNHDKKIFTLFLRTDPPKNCPSGLVKEVILSEIQLWISFEANRYEPNFTDTQYLNFVH